MEHPSARNNGYQSLCVFEQQDPHEIKQSLDKVADGLELLTAEFKKTIRLLILVLSIIALGRVLLESAKDLFFPRMTEQREAK